MDWRSMSKYTYKSVYPSLKRWKLWNLINTMSNHILTDFLSPSWYCKNINRSQAENLLKTEVSIELWGQSKMWLIYPHSNSMIIKNTYTFLIYIYILKVALLSWIRSTYLFNLYSEMLSLKNRIKMVVFWWETLANSLENTRSLCSPRLVGEFDQATHLFPS